MSVGVPPRAQFISIATGKRLSLFFASLSLMSPRRRRGRSTAIHETGLGGLCLIRVNTSYWNSYRSFLQPPPSSPPETFNRMNGDPPWMLYVEVCEWWYFTSIVRIQLLVIAPRNLRNNRRSCHLNTYMSAAAPTGRILFNVIPKAHNLFWLHRSTRV